MTDKLYKVTCTGMKARIANGVAHGVAFVVAKDPGAAYAKLKRYLDRANIGYKKDRELHNVELVADCGDYPNCGYRLFL